MQSEVSISIEDLYPDKFDVDDDENGLEEDFNYPNTFLALRKQRSRSRLRNLSSVCSLCGQSALRPFRMTCCRKVLCAEHLQDRLDASSSLCPSCGSRCSADIVISPSSLTLPSSLRVSSQRDSDSSGKSSNTNSRTSSVDRDVYAYVDSKSDCAEGTVYTPIRDTTSSALDPELAGLAEGVLGKVLSIVALTLVFYVLLN
ncbi:hypothetical protein J3R30DRAFT_3588532 [Lentinula aciculospora]|uniref:Uncharacterized protein n=1 Tax=Lentinula aciculospora TaxID=153920 RepID=A0A9W8ZUQ9_9AGAR|nr:hypothetical protein J3R30DRAFT_3588532 [Lentinula aciculospora]